MIPKSQSKKSKSKSVGLLLTILLLAVVTQAQTPAVSLTPEITTVAGNGTQAFGGNGGPATSAELNNPYGVAVDSAGNLYIADNRNHRVRKVNAATGVITTVAGNGIAGYSGDGGAATGAELNNPYGIAVDSTGNLFIADAVNQRIRKVSVAGVITTVAGNGSQSFAGDGGPATSAALNDPFGIAVDSAGNLYIADNHNHRIRKVNAATHIITTVAGNGVGGFGGDVGPAIHAELSDPYGVAVDLAGNLYIADSLNNRIRKVTAATGVITTVAGTSHAGMGGDGEEATLSALNTPYGIAVDSAANLYIADSLNNRIRKVTAATGKVTNVAGTGMLGFNGDNILGGSAELNLPPAVAVDAAGNVYIADIFNNRVRKVSGETAPVSFPETAVGSASASRRVLIGFNSTLTISSISVPKSQGGKQEFSVGTLDGCRADGVTRFNLGEVCTVPVTFHPGYPGSRQVPLVVKTSAGTFYFGMEGIGLGPQTALLPGVITTAAGGGSGCAGQSDSFGDGCPATSAQLNSPQGIAVDFAGNQYFADSFNNIIRKVSAATGVITTVAGNGFGAGGIGDFSGDGGPATSAELNNPQSVAVDSAGNLYISDSANYRIRKVSAATGVITTVAGNGAFGSGDDGVLATSTQVNFPSGLALDLAGNLYLADIFFHRVRKVSAATGVITTVAGNGFGAGGQGAYSGDGGPATSAELNFPVGVTVDSTGNLYIADSSNERIRKVSARTGVITTVAGNGTDGFRGDGGLATSAELSNPFAVAVDSAGSLYIADDINQRIRKVNAATGVITTVAGDGNFGYSGDGGPATSAKLADVLNVALDSAGNLYIIDNSNSRIRKVSVTSPPLSFPQTNVGSNSAAQKFTLANIGNAPLKLSSITPSTNFKSSGSTCSTSSAVAAGNSCTVGVVFSPTATGAHTGTITLKDNALNVTGATQQVKLSGIGK